MKSSDNPSPLSPASDNAAAEALADLRATSGSLAGLRTIWEKRQHAAWAGDVAIYRQAVGEALKLGEAFLAYDIAREGLRVFAGDVRLLQLQALALARTGATRRASAILVELREQGRNDEETFGILARTHKDLWMIAPTKEEREHHLRRSLKDYLKGYECSGGYYTGINAASMALVAGETETAQRIANEVGILCEEGLAKAGPASPELYWLLATAAEAALVSGDLDSARINYTRATTESDPGAAEVSRTRGQARFLLQCHGEDEHALDDCFVLPRIGLFTGHMLDRPDRPAARFPAALEETVRTEIEACIERRDVRIGYSSLACGGDMLFAESILKRGGEVHIFLPFDIETFIEYSVRLVPRDDLVERFHRVLDNAASVRTLNDQGDPDDAAVYDYCNRVLAGAAILKSQFLGMDITPILLWDGKRGDGGGGTESVHNYWRDTIHHEVEIMPMDQILADALANGLTSATPTPKPAITAEPADRTPQEIRAMLFADVVGFSSWPEQCIPPFIREFLGRVAAIQEKSDARPLYVNTWGDAICAVFENVETAGVFALALQNTLRETDWKTTGLQRDICIRIGLHAGPVYKCFDPLLGRDTYNGAHVNRAARIEPVAEEGQIFASDAFAALAAIAKTDEFRCDYAGIRELPKGAGVLSTFLVRPAC
ncbi:MAG TPA: adenylate/guanylate cyclase domain-containing protein [Verrucomicrobiota bacterium]|nr:adenylate/guanylate cyclase domain-containing protein [Verrucomicrobiota bacterium]